MRDLSVIDALDALERYARAFDAISDEQDARYSARSFVRWLRLETTAPTGRGRSRSAARRIGRPRSPWPKLMLKLKQPGDG